MDEMVLGALLGFAAGAILMRLRMGVLLRAEQRRFGLVEHAVRGAQEALMGGMPAEARDYLRGVLPENPESHQRAYYPILHRDAR